MTLLKQVSIPELQYMRDEGLSNKEIASRLGVSVSSIYRLIGKQPKEIDGRRNNGKVLAESSEWDGIIPDDTALSDSMKVKNHVVSIEGKSWNYKVTIEPGEPEKKFSISILRHGDTFGTHLEVLGEEVNDFLREISTISSQFSKL